jgi:hypothetical protein
MSTTNLAKDLKNVSEKDRKQIEQAQEMLGPDPDTMGFIKNVFWGNFREDLIFPYPESTPEEAAKCNQMVVKLDDYLRNEHPSAEIDRTQEIPEWAVKRLFEIGILGMTIPAEYGGGGLGITSYNRVLERIGRSCSSTAVLVSAHQSIGCKALMLFGTDEQKDRFLRPMASDTLSAFCLSEPNVGSDAGGQETRCELSEDGTHFILNGEKKWATSGALSGLFTVMTKQEFTDPKNRQEQRQGHRPDLHPGHGRRRHLQPQPQQVRHSRHLAGPHQAHQCEGPGRKPPAQAGQGTERRTHLPQLRPLHLVGRHGRGCSLRPGTRRQVGEVPLPVRSPHR